MSCELSIFFFGAQLRQVSGVQEKSCAEELDLRSCDDGEFPYLTEGDLFRKSGITLYEYCEKVSE